MMKIIFHKAWLQHRSKVFYIPMNVKSSAERAVKIATICICRSCELPSQGLLCSDASVIEWVSYLIKKIVMEVFFTK